VPDHDGVIVRRRVLDADIVREQPASDEELSLANRTAIFHARCQRGVAAAVQVDAAARFVHAAAGLNIDDSGGEQAVFGRQRPVRS